MPRRGEGDELLMQYRKAGMHNPKIQIHQARAMRRYQPLDLINLIDLIGPGLRATVLVEHETCRTGHPPDTCAVREQIFVLLIEFTIIEQQGIPRPRGSITARVAVLLQPQVLLQERRALEGVVVLDGAHGADGVVIVICRGTTAQTSSITRH